MEVRYRGLLVSFIALVQISATFADLCRLKNQEYKREVFLKRSCTLCYKNTPNAVFFKKLEVAEDTNQLFDPSINQTVESDYTNQNGPAYKSFRNDSYAKEWGECCKAAKSCCDLMTKSTSDMSKECPRDWDELNCWNGTSRGRSVELDCPDYYGSYLLQKRSPCRRYVKRECMSSNNWTKTERYCEPLEFQRENQGWDQTNEDSSRCCRTEREMELSYEAFKLDTCARCYIYIDKILLNNPLSYNSNTGKLFNSTSKESFFANPFNPSDSILETFRHKRLKENWIQCCKNAVKCCDHMIKNETRPAAGEKCPKTWDGWTCFDSARPGTISRKECPKHAYNHMTGELSCKRYSSKNCTEKGYWFRKVNSTTEYTDYVTCGRSQELRSEIKGITTTFSISMAALFPAIIIFNVYRQLRINRIKMHVQLFLSLFLNAFTGCIFYGIVIIDDLNSNNPIRDTNGPGCQFLTILTKYFRLCTYSWMLCEGYYLHRQIARAFSEQRNFVPFYIVGWLLPALPVSVFAIVRQTVFNEKCWIAPSDYDYIFHIPELLCLLLNFGFLSHVIFILVSKLRSVRSSMPSYFKKALRATLVLIPLFGVHYFLILYAPTGGSCLKYQIFRYTNIVVDGLQGTVVSIIYCYSNGEVISLLKRSYDRFQTMRGVGHRTRRMSRGRSSVTQVSSIYDPNSVSNRQAMQPNKAAAIQLSTISGSVTNKSESINTEL